MPLRDCVCRRRRHRRRKADYCVKERKNLARRNVVSADETIRSALADALPEMVRARIALATHSRERWISYLEPDREGARVCSFSSLLRVNLDSSGQNGDFRGRARDRYGMHLHTCSTCTSQIDAAERAGLRMPSFLTTTKLYAHANLSNYPVEEFLFPSSLATLRPIRARGFFFIALPT